MPPAVTLALPGAPTVIWSTCPGVTLSVAVTEPPRPPGAVPGYEPPCAPRSLKVAVVTPAGTVNVPVPVALYVQDVTPAVPFVPHGFVGVAAAPGAAAADAVPEATKSVPPIRPIAPIAGSIRKGFTLCSFLDSFTQIA